MKKNAWITWEVQSRNRSMAELFDADFYEVVYKGGKIKRYISCLKDTFKIFKKDYDVVFVQNPSILLSFFSVVINVFFKKVVVIDAHNAGIYPFEARYPLLLKVNDWILKKSDLVIITNSKLEMHLIEKEIDCAIVPDPLPKIKVDKAKLISEDFVFIICSWAEDEPIKEYLELVEMNPDVNFYFSGNSNKYFKSDNVIFPSNMRLLGFIEKSHYDQLLASCLLSIDLTLRNDCLVCGAYESLALNKKTIVTDNEVNRELFGNAVLYSLPSSNSLSNALRYGLDTCKKEEISEFKSHYHDYLEQRKKTILQKIHS